MEKPGPGCGVKKRGTRHFAGFLFFNCLCGAEAPMPLPGALWPVRGIIRRPGEKEISCSAIGNVY